MQQLPISPKQMAELMNLMRTAPGKQLMNMLQKEKGPELRRALDQQDVEAARRILGDFLENPQVKDLLRQLGH